MKIKHSIWALRFRFGYLKRYGWHHNFAFGFLLGPLLFYKKKDMVYYQYQLDRDAILLIDSGFASKMMYEEARKKLFESILYDLGFTFIETFADYDIDSYKVRLSGFPRPI